MSELAPPISAHGVIHCTKCGARLESSGWNSGGVEPCPSCGSKVRVEVFPAFFTGLQRGDAGERVLGGEEASCFYHEGKKAVVACESCGRFLCALCDIDFHGQHLCPGCLDSGQRKGALPNIEKNRLLYDNIALSLATLPLLMWPVTILTAPAAIFVAIRYWKTPGSIIPRTHLRSIFAILIAGAQIAGWATLITFLINR